MSSAVSFKMVSEANSEGSTTVRSAEYVAACQAVKELVWIKKLVAELSSNENIKAKFYMNNQSAIRLVKNPVFYKRKKHIDVQYHFIHYIPYLSRCSSLTKLPFISW